MKDGNAPNVFAYDGREMSEISSDLTAASDHYEMIRPPRYRWLKRGALIGTILVGLLSGIRWWWGFDTQRRINAIMETARIRGELTLPAEFDPPHSIPESDNSAATFSRAAAAIDYAEPSSETDFQAMRSIATKNTLSRALARTARSQHSVDWGGRYDPINHVLRGNFSKLNFLRSLGNVLQYSAAGEFTKGHDEEAVATIRDIRALARAINAQANSQVPFFVAMGISNGGNEQLLRFAPGLAARDGNAGTSPVALQMRALITELLDESDDRNSIARGLQAGRTQAFEDAVHHPGLFSPLGMPMTVNSSVATVLRPMFLRTELRYATDLRLLERSVGCSSLPAALASVPAQSLPTTFADHSALEIAARGLNPYPVQMERSLRVIFIERIDRRATAVVLALRLYQFDHGGQLPAALLKLVPNYLAALPIDPMRSDDKPFGYLPRASPPVLYSVGVDGIDDGGSTVPVPPAVSSENRWEDRDAVYKLISTVSQSPTIP